MFVYLFISDNSCWEDIIVILSKEDAIQKSIKYPHCRVEIFSINNTNEYHPTYNYYKNGEFYYQNL